MAEAGMQVLGQRAGHAPAPILDIVVGWCWAGADHERRATASGNETSSAGMRSSGPKQTIGTAGWMDHGCCARSTNSVPCLALLTSAPRLEGMKKDLARAPESH